MDHLVAEDPAVLQLYNTDPLNEQETAVLDLFQLTSLGSDGSKDDERIFLATVGAVFLDVDVDAQHRRGSGRSPRDEDVGDLGAVERDDDIVEPHARRRG